nr:zinc finger BED domain-containing protein RICESLEEPER 2-like [Ipomoea batatas]
MSTVRSMHVDESHETVQKEPEIAPSVGMECNDGENKNKKRKTSRQRSEVWDHFTKRMYSIDQASVLCSKLREVTSQLFNEYNELLKVSQGEGSNFSQSLSVINEDCDDQPHNVLNIETDFQKYLVEIGRGEQKSELDKYINEELDTQTGGGEFDILRWWKANAHRFPVLSCMARDRLAVPVSTVASESAFSTCGRVLDTYRSSLTPKIVQALVCTQDWLREENLISMNDLVEHDVGEMYKLDMDMSKMGLDSVIDYKNRRTRVN